MGNISQTDKLTSRLHVTPSTTEQNYCLVQFISRRLSYADTSTPLCWLDDWLKEGTVRKPFVSRSLGGSLSGEDATTFNPFPRSKTPQGSLSPVPIYGKLGCCAEKAGDKWPEEDPYVMKPIDTDGDRSICESRRKRRLSMFFCGVLTPSRQQSLSSAKQWMKFAVISSFYGQFACEALVFVVLENRNCFICMVYDWFV